MLVENNNISEMLSSYQLGEIQKFGNISWELIHSNVSHENKYLCLSDALKLKDFKIQEISESGEVPKLHCINNTAHYVLIIQGEEIVGAKQNRIINISVIIPPKSKILLPVSCVEVGRWEYEEEFSKGYGAFTDLKRDVLENSIESYDHIGEYSSDQGSVWEGISNAESFFNTKSKTGSMNDLYDKIKSSYKVFNNKVVIGDALGITIFINDTVAGLEIFYSNTFFKQIKDDLLMGYYMEAEMNKDSDKSYSTFEKAEYVMKYLSKMDPKPISGIGEGINLNVKTRNIVGSLLCHNDELTHCTVHPKNNNKPQNNSKSEDGSQNDILF